MYEFKIPEPQIRRAFLKAQRCCAVRLRNVLGGWPPRGFAALGIMKILACVPWLIGLLIRISH
jgi:hypothetical protein